MQKAEVNVQQGLPAGTLTFLFTDLEGSTQLWEQYPEPMRAAMRRHDALVESAVGQHTGMLVRPRGEGDSRFAVFKRASQALQAAIDIQRYILDEPWTVPALRVRVALHTGEAELREDDYYGAQVNRCARLRNAAHGRQILVSETTRCLAWDSLPDGVSLRDLGVHNLKDLKYPEKIYQVVAPGLPAEFPTLRTPDQARNNLPLALTSFIGRDSEIKELTEHLFQSRLLTVAGPGGAGKTRLALEVARQVQDSFPDGTWFVDLAAISDSSLVDLAVMNALGVREEAGISPTQSLLEALKSKDVLLLLDNCEHLLPDLVQLVENMLHSAPRLRILATSREKLSVAGEILWRIPSLSSPGKTAAVPLENLVQYEAVRLFQERAQAVRPDFTINRENAQVIAQIGARLDGIPLAIELAAARVRVLSVEEILTRLDDRFHLLVGNRTALPRQQTLGALVAWSYDLLTPQERLLLDRLSVFAGSWTLEAAEQVCAGEGIQEGEVLELLTCLVDKSLVIGLTRSRHGRFRFLETIHKFSQERLAESQAGEAYAQKHACYYLELATEAYGKMWGSEQTHWLGVMDDEQENLRLALARFSQIPANETLLLQMAGNLWRYWEIRGYITEGRTWLETALAKDTGTDVYLRANGLGGAGHLARQQGDYARAKALHEQSLGLFREIGFKLNVARQLNALGEIAQHLGDYSLSIQLHEESLAIRQEIDDKEGIAVSLRQLGVIARDRGQYQQARELLEKSLEIERQLGDRLLVALSLDELGLIARHLCEYPRAAFLFEEAVSIQRDLNDRLGISNSLQNLGNVAKDRGDFREATRLYHESLEIKQELGDRRGICYSITTLAEVAFWQGKYPRAAELAGQSLALAQEVGIKRAVLRSLELQGFIAYYQGETQRAATIAGDTLAMSIQMETPRESGYARILGGLCEYSSGRLVEAKSEFEQALEIFQEIDDHRNMAAIYVNLARTAYRQGDPQAARKYLDSSLTITQELGIRWTLGYVLEIMGLLQRSEGDYRRALKFFQESLRIAVEQENQQGIANCLGGMAGLAVMANQPERAARLFAAASRLRREVGAKMSTNDQLEYEQYVTMVHRQLDHATFEAEWSEGFSMSTADIIEDLKGWTAHFGGGGATEDSRPLNGKKDNFPWQSFSMIDVAM